MALEEFRDDMSTCCRCSACKFVPLETLKGYDHVEVCPSIARFDYRAYSGGGRIGIGMALLDKALDYTSPKLRDIIYNCQMCGGCDIACKYAMDMEVLEPMNEIRAECVKHHNTHPVLDKLIDSLKNGGPMVIEANAGQGEWASKLGIKDYTKQKVQVIYHAGCRTRHDKARWPIAQQTIKLMQKANIDVGIAADEPCCGGRAYQMGYQDEAINKAKRNIEIFKKSGAKTLVTGCAECYFAFKVLYDKFGVKGDLEILHTSEFFNRLIQQGKLKPLKKVNMTVTYHDPCHLGRQGEPYINWKGKRVPGQLIVFDPPKEFRRGDKGVYAPPRELLQSIPGLKLVEMDRHKEFAWCCGSGGGVKETNPEYALWTATKRIEEAADTKAEAIATGCPGCENLFDAAIQKNNSDLKVYDIVEILAKAIL
jgi:Fe-S oxidoreductase